MMIEIDISNKNSKIVVNGIEKLVKDYNIIENDHSGGDNRNFYLKCSDNYLVTVNFDVVVTYRDFPFFLPFHIVKLDLSNNRLIHLTGIGSLKELKYLDVSHNFIKDTIGLSQMTELQVLIMNNNELSQIKEICACSHLVELNCSDNKIRNTMDVREISLCVKLKRVSFARNPLATDVAKRKFYKASILHLLPYIEILDGILLPSAKCSNRYSSSSTSVGNGSKRNRPIDNISEIDKMLTLASLENQATAFEMKREIRNFLSRNNLDHDVNTDIVNNNNNNKNNNNNNAYTSNSASTADLENISNVNINSSNNQDVDDDHGLIKDYIFKVRQDMLNSIKYFEQNYV